MLLRFKALVKLPEAKISHPQIEKGHYWTYGTHVLQIRVSGDVHALSNPSRITITPRDKKTDHVFGPSMFGPMKGYKLIFGSNFAEVDPLDKPANIANMIAAMQNPYLVFISGVWRFESDLYSGNCIISVTDEKYDYIDSDFENCGDLLAPASQASKSPSRCTTCKGESIVRECQGPVVCPRCKGVGLEPTNTKRGKHANKEDDEFEKYVLYPQV